MRFVEIAGDKVTSIVGGGSPKLFQGADWFNLEYQGAYNATVVSTAKKHRGNSSICLSLPVSAGAVDRSEISVSHEGNPYEYMLGQVRYFGFAMYLDPEAVTLPLDGDIVFAQLYQGNAAHWGGVPCTATLLPDTDPLQWQVAMRADASDTSALRPQSSLRLGVWHQFLFKFLANSNEMDELGDCALWLDGQFVGSVHHDMGSDLRPTDPTYPVTDDDWMIRCGMYRTDAGVAQPHRAYFDEIRLGAHPSTGYLVG